MSPWVRRLQLALLAAVVAATAALAVLEAGSETGLALRARQPILALVSLPSAPSMFLAVYHPGPRSLDLLQVASEAAGGKARAPTFEEAQRLLDPDPGGPRGLPRPLLRLEAALGGEAGESSPRLRDWISAWPRGARYALAAGAAAANLVRGGAVSAYDAALLALELYRLDPAAVRVAWLPGPALRPRLVDLLLAPPGRASDPSRLRAEVQNASGEAGVALQATKALRAHGVDVVDFASAAALEARTRVVDRAGRPGDARLLAELLGCPGAEVWLRLEPEAAVPLAVILGKDYRRCMKLPQAR